MKRKDDKEQDAIADQSSSNGSLTNLLS